MKHTSICLTDEKAAKIASTGKPMNALINEAIDNYFLGSISISENRIQEELKKFLFSEEMQAYFKNEVKEALLPALGLYLPKVDKSDILKKAKAES